jgi:hypothetical protein
MAAGISVRLARGWLYPNRVPGQHFAMIGPIDIDRDGRDDRGRLVWMILRNGGMVDYDLPVAGPPRGAIRPRTTCYIYDDWLVPGATLPASFLKAQDEAIKKARLDDIRPIPLGKFLAILSGEARLGPDAILTCGSSGPAPRAAEPGR